MLRPLRNRASAYCPKCQAHTEQSRGQKRGERLCHSCGEPFTLEESREAEHGEPHLDAVDFKYDEQDALRA